MKDRYVTDTMALVLRLESRRLGRRGKAIFKNAEIGQTELLVPVMVLAEIGYLSEKERIEATLQDFREYRRGHSAIQILPITEEVMTIALTRTLPL